MRVFAPIEPRTYAALYRCALVGNMLALLTVIIAGFSARYHWLVRSGSVAALLFMAAQLIVLYCGRSESSESNSVEPGTTVHNAGRAGGAAQ